MTAHSGFFESKRAWSKYKDRILARYLKPYLAKVSAKGFPVVLFDCFAGDGKYEDGSPGSPLLIRKAIIEQRRRGSEISAVFSDNRRSACKSLEYLFQDLEYTSVYCETFKESCKRIALAADDSSIFGFLDPFGVKAMPFTSLDQVLEGRAHRMELLMNVNFRAFARIGRACLKSEGGEFKSMDSDKVSFLFGSEKWRGICAVDKPFVKVVSDLEVDYLSRLRSKFAFVESYHVFERYDHSIPKYSLVFTCNHPDAVELMNDDMCSARDEFINQELEVASHLFDPRSLVEQHSDQVIEPLILDMLKLKGEMRRGDLIAQVMQENYAVHMRKHYRGVIESLVRKGGITTKSGKKRFNDNEIVFIPLKTGSLF